MWHKKEWDILEHLVLKEKSLSIPSIYGSGNHEEEEEKEEEEEEEEKRRREN